MNLHLPSLILTFLITVICGLLALDSFTNTEKVKALIGISSYSLVIPALLIQLVARLRKKVFIVPIFARLAFRFVLPTVALVTFFLTLLDWSLPINFVYSITKLHQEQLGLVSLYLLLTSLINQSDAWWKNYQSRFIQLLPYAFFVCALLVRMWPWNIFFELVKEDKIIEQLQATVLFGGFVVGSYLAFQAYKKHQLRLVAVMVMASLALGLVSFEEISWGQRLIGFSTPAEISEHNLQNETTIHNLDGIHQQVNFLYVAIGLGGIFGRSILSNRLLKKKKQARLAQNKQYFGYFIFPLLYYSSSFVLPEGMFREWSEVMELYLYSGMTLLILERGYLELKKS